jgi:hypothetical protein
MAVRLEVIHCKAARITPDSVSRRARARVMWPIGAARVPGIAAEWAVLAAWVVPAVAAEWAVLAAWVVPAA